MLMSLLKGANVNAADTNGDTALHIASRNCNKHLVELLVEYGALMKLANDAGFAALHLASRNCI